MIQDKYGNYRYQGSTADNYVTFNDERANWRIVGLFDVDGEQRVKIVIKVQIGRFSWDSSDSSVNSGTGINQWGPSGTYEGADLMRELNGDYLNSSLSENTLWYNGENNKKEGTFNKDYALKTSAQELIGDATWYTGSMPFVNTITLEEAYAYERGTQGKMCSSGSKCNDNVERTYTWTGKVGLIYSSDYGYASGNSNCATNISYGNYYCDSNWIAGSGWTITPASSPSYSDYEWDTRSNYMGNYTGNNAPCVCPAVYLLPDIQIKGSGTMSDPYVFAK
ncbi:MAG: hypothetical protein IJK66_05680 [Bacilli bacterium]|nr:hypothetical protein [Bacilli bacterium]